MTVVRQLPNRVAQTSESSPNGPIVVMAYPGAGADQLRSVLSAFPGLACTQQTGILPLFHHAVTTWQAVDGGGGGGISPLAAASLRALSAGLMTAVLARQGGGRWCEFATAPPAAARSFAELYPQARFLVVHCRAETAAHAIVGSSRWGPEGTEFAPFVSAYPASPVAALASYWVAHAAPQLEFEQAQPGKCLRVRIEGLTANSAQTLLAISDFLALDDSGMPPFFARNDDQAWQAAADAAAPGLPIDRIPAPLLARVNELHRSLGYSPVAAAEV